ncbi:MAG: hypothetical protein E6J20_08535 [Chloroflexi bacterium]|nr:MAG: hypothetical protein E6J20_08535 [Chloroflexota bacterium]
MGNTLRRLFARLGPTGLFIVLAAVIFGVLAGGVVVHRLETSPSASQEQQQEAADQGDQSDKTDQAKKPKSNNGHGNSHASKARTEPTETD